VTPHLPYSHLFGALQDTIHGMKTETDDDVSCAMRSWLQGQDKAMYWHGIHTLVPHSWEAVGSGRRLCGKMGYRFKPSLFILCDFHYFGI